MENIKGQNIIAGIFANPNKKRALEAVSAAKSILDRVGVRWADCGKPDTIYEGGTVDMLLAIGVMEPYCGPFTGWSRDAGQGRLSLG